MIARAAIALVVTALAVRAQPQSIIWLDVPTIADDPEEVEKRYTPELVEELQSAKADALLLYTEYTARASSDLKMFIRNISGLTNDTLRYVDWSLLQSSPQHCRKEFERVLKKFEYDAHRAASFSGENHHKFLLGHMIVLRMHLNKSEEYIKKCDNVIRNCGVKCETTPQITRWRRLAAHELHRVRDDIQHSRKSYRDLVAHAHRRLNTLRKRATLRARDAIADFTTCVQGG